MPNLFTIILDYRGFILSELKAIVNDGSLEPNTEMKTFVCFCRTLLDDRLDFLLQNINGKSNFNSPLGKISYMKKVMKLYRNRTSNSNEDEVSGNLGYTSRVKEELNAITSLKSAKNYLNHKKIRQRFWVMFL